MLSFNNSIKKFILSLYIIFWNNSFHKLHIKNFHVHMKTDQRSVFWSNLYYSGGFRQVENYTNRMWMGMFFTTPVTKDHHSRDWSYFKVFSSRLIVDYCIVVINSTTKNIQLIDWINVFDTAIIAMLRWRYIRSWNEIINKFTEW